jgi:hypothetical protein
LPPAPPPVVPPVPPPEQLVGATQAEVSTQALTVWRQAAQSADGCPHAKKHAVSPQLHFCVQPT